MPRPPDDDEPRTEVVRVRVTPAQHARWRALADALGVDLSTAIRDTMDARAWLARDGDDDGDA